MKNDEPEFMKPSEVAALFRVDVKTVHRWINLGMFGDHGTNWIRTPVGRKLIRREYAQRRAATRNEVRS